MRWGALKNWFQISLFPRCCNRRSYQKRIEPIHISILTEVGVSDKYIYSRLKSDFNNNLKQLAEVQCKRNQINQLQLSRLYSKIRSRDLEVFSIFPNSGNYITTIGESIYHFRCRRKLLRPIFLNNGRCYNNLPILELDKEVMTSKTNKSLFFNSFW